MSKYLQNEFKAMQAKGITLRDLAEESEYSISTIAGLKDGRRLITPWQAVRLERAAAKRQHFLDCTKMNPEYFNFLESIGFGRVEPNAQ